MIGFSKSAGLVAAATLALLWAVPAQAQATRTWVSGVGDDANPCSRTAPCKTFAGAIAKTAGGGEIDVLDPGGFGGVTVTKAITIDGSGGSIAGVLVSGSPGVTVNALAADTVTLRNLDFEGLGATTSTPGTFGIRFIAGSALSVEHCVIRNFRDPTNGNGIMFAPSGASKLFVSDTILSGNGNVGTNAGAGITIQPTGSGSAKASITHTIIENNQRGLRADGTGSTGGIMVTVNDVMASGNVNAGFAVVTPVGGATVKMAINNSQSVNNATGLNSDGAGATMRIGSSLVAENGTFFSAPNSGTITSVGNNQVIDNPSGPSTALAIIGPQ